MTPQTPAQRRCCLVVGMHNSGTSLVGNLLDAAGLPLGKQLLQRDTIPEPLRPRYDYFEDAEVVALQEATLLSLQRHWSSFRGSFPLPSADHPARQQIRRQLKTLLRHRLAQSRLWVVKDPRTAALLDDWLQVLVAIDIDPKLLIVHREPGPTIASFSSKAGVPALWAEALWQRSYANALAAARWLSSDQVCFTSFETLLARPEAETRRLCEWLGWPPSAALAERVAKRFDPSLPTAITPAATPTLHPTSHQLISQLRSGATGQHGPDESALLSAQLLDALTPEREVLELNTLHRSGQTLLPKHSVWIVTAELQGWGPSGGIGSAYRELAEALAEAGHPVRVLLVRSEAETPASPLPRVSVQHLDPHGLSRLEICRRVARLLREGRPDVVHLHEWLGIGSGLREALGADGPWLCVGLHGPSGWVRSGNPWRRSADGGLQVEEEAIQTEGLIMELERDTLAQADLLLAPSRFMAEWVQEHLRAATGETPVLVQRNCGLSRRLPPIAENNHEPNDVLVFFGRLEQRKGLLLFLDAIETMMPPPREVRLLGGDCRIEETRWASEVVRERLTARGVIHRIHTDLPRDQALALLLELQAVVVIPSLIENSPCVVEELLDTGLRLVVTDVGGSRELVSRASQAWLSPAEPEALARHLETALTSANPAAYRLKALIPPWTIALSWQAFHERLPRKQAGTAAPHGSASRGRRLSRRLASAVWRRLRGQR